MYSGVNSFICGKIQTLRKGKIRYKTIQKLNYLSFVHTVQELLGPFVEGSLKCEWKFRQTLHLGTEKL